MFTDSQILREVFDTRDSLLVYGSSLNNTIIYETITK